MEPILSVIIPVYNSERVLNRCLESLQHQSNQNFFVILVNDGSFDCSLDICNEFIAQNDKWKVYSIANSGPSGARNYGLEKATTEYITFIDADDYVESNYIDALIKCVESGDVQLGIVNYKEINCEKIRYHKVHAHYSDAMEWITFNYLWAPWGKIIKKDLIQKNFNIDYKIAEDIHFWLDNLYKEKVKFQFISSTFYYYTVDHTSITRTNHIGSNQISGLNSILDIIVSTKGSLQLFFKKYYVSLFSSYRYRFQNWNNGIDQKYTEFYQLYYQELQASRIGFRDKLALFFKVKFTKLYYRLKGV